MINCALFEPDIPQNAGAVLRIGACFGVPIHIIHPCGFVLTDRSLKRAGLDYLSRASIIEHADFSAFDGWRRGAGRRLVALSAHAATALPAFAFRPDDAILLGRETSGLSEEARSAADAIVRIPIRPGNRSLNMAVAAGLGLFEALRQTGALPVDEYNDPPRHASLDRIAGRDIAGAEKSKGSQ